MAQRKSTATEAEPDTAEIKDGAEAQVTDQDTVVTFDMSMAELTMARRLYDIWCTVGGLTDERWIWSRQSERSRAAWIAVARAASPPVLAKRWSASTLAGLLHG
jgi:hypothetical protein